MSSGAPVSSVASSASPPRNDEITDVIASEANPALWEDAIETDTLQRGTSCGEMNAPCSAVSHTLPEASTFGTPI